MTWRLPALLQGCADAVPDIAVPRLVSDSRELRPGDVFVALSAVRGDGHGLDYIDQAMAAGAAAVLVEPAAGRHLPGQLPAIAIPELRCKLGEIAARFYGNPADALFTVGVTGTDGKTTTAWLIAEALERLGKPCRYIGTLGSGRLEALGHVSHTTPDPIRLQADLAATRDEGLRAVAMEVSSHALDQHRVAGMGFDVAILTNLARDHLDYHGAENDYAAAKRRLFTEHCRGVSVLNRDDRWGARWLAEGADVIAYGLGGDDDGDVPVVRAELMRQHRDGMAFELRPAGPAHAVNTTLMGRFNLYNLLAAACALREGGFEWADVARVLADVGPPPGRMERFTAPVAPLAVIDYAHTPNALAAALAAARDHCDGRLILVFGCGGDRDAGKRPLMGEAAAAGADQVIVTTDNPRSEDPDAIAAAIVGAHDEFEVIHDRAEAIHTALRHAGERDLVMIAGKGHETTQVIGGVSRPFSDRDVVRQWLSRRGAHA
ncbi:UDP-N-acetylmuramoyl-L-alanyl-D-glutamate--2,6-diaminopimelate ligase [Polycyclovorans algicola]|uniref:UDP-N-acetylmuramoyl-L-alanyl-D-glutamate--2, 6-diaminopimelate ligase n=1 Tax=Polycyclovorans algicola TaxID=616992 RepID=UPI000693C433|nr:UDP-N-acetylmuramoyl-L-alanyl-D-glutamate--2,6-diaminopimelate ligase [Polycyclovorans algicola]